MIYILWVKVLGALKFCHATETGSKWTSDKLKALVKIQSLFLYRLWKPVWKHEDFHECVFFYLFVCKLESKLVFYVTIHKYNYALCTLYPFVLCTQTARFIANGWMKLLFMFHRILCLLWIHLKGDISSNGRIDIRITKTNPGQEKESGCTSIMSVN